VSTFSSLAEGEDGVGEVDTVGDYTVAVVGNTLVVVCGLVDAYDARLFRRVSVATFPLLLSYRFP